MSIKELFSEIGLSLVAVIGGIGGSLLSIVMNDKQISFKGAIAQMISGIMFSGYGTEFLLKWLHLEEKSSLVGLLGFCLGMCGMMVAKGVLKIGKRFERNPTKFLNKTTEIDDTDN